MSRPHSNSATRCSSSALTVARYTIAFALLLVGCCRDGALMGVALAQAPNDDAPGSGSGAANLAAEPLGLDPVGHTYQPEEGFRDKVTRISIRGKVDLPDGAILVVRLTEPASRWVFQAKGPVAKGAFSIDLGPYERPLFPGHYEIGAAFFTDNQPAALYDALASRASCKASSMWSFEPERIATATAAYLAETIATADAFEKLGSEITGWIVELRAADAAKKFPLKGTPAHKDFAETPAYKAMETRLNLWAIRYDALRKAHDERLDGHLIVPTVQVERLIGQLTNVLMDLQFEHECFLTGDRDFFTQRDLDVVVRLRAEVQHQLAYDRIRLATVPGDALATAIGTHAAALAPDTSFEPPARETVQAALDAGVDALHAERRRAAIYREALHWHTQVDQLDRDWAEAQAPAAKLEVANRWLLEFRRHRAAPVDASLAGIDPLRAIFARLALAALLRLADRCAADGVAPALASRPASDPLDVNVALALDRCDLGRVHLGAVRLAWHEASELCRTLAARSRAATSAFDGQEWEEQMVAWSSAVLRLLEAELPAIGPLAGDRDLLARYTTERSALASGLLEMTRQRFAIEAAVASGKPDATAIEPAAAALDALAAQATAEVARLAK